MGIAADDNNTITNSGSIWIGGDLGIAADNNNTIANSGSIYVDGNIGIDALDNNTIANNGSIDVGVDLGIFAGNNNTITNSGSIRVGGDGGIAAFSNNTITNSGSIHVGGTFGILAFEDNNTIINSGSVVAAAPGALSIDFGGGTNTLSLLRGSRIVGLISLGMGNDTVNLGRGENWLMSFQAADGAPEVLNVFGVPVATINGGLTVATFDPATSLFGSEDAALSDLTGVVRDGLQHRLTAGNPTTYAWATTIDAMRREDRDGLNGDGSELGGVMVGFTTPLGPNVRGGLFTGYVESDLDSAHAGSIGDTSLRHEIDIKSIFGGLYGRAFLGAAFADLIVTVGSSDNNSRRRILNNLAPTGVEFANGSYNGWLVNPDLQVGVEVPWGGFKLVPSASIGYSGLFLDGFEEQGSMAAIALEDRNIELIDGRLQIELRNAGRTAAGPWHTEVRAGIKGRSSLGEDSLSGVLAESTAFSIRVEEDGSVLAGFGGADLTFSLTPDVQVFAGGQAAFEDNGSQVFSGRLGGSVKF